MILILSLTNAKSQEKSVNGDTSNVLRSYKALSNKIGLQDFSISIHDFDFRFWNDWQVLEIWEEKDSIRGVLANYSFRIDKKSNNIIDTLFEKICIDSKNASAAYQIVHNSKILNIPSDYMIKGWRRSWCGINYIIEHADSQNYWFKSYYSPSSLDSIKEAVMVMDFVKKISDTLDLIGSYKKFKRKLPHKYCYNWEGAVIWSLIRNYYELGYWGSVKLPVGCIISCKINRIGKLISNFGLNVYFPLDNHDNYDFSTTFYKSSLFIHKHENLSDFIAYNYRQRKLNFIEDGIKYQNN